MRPAAHGLPRRELREAAGRQFNAMQKQCWPPSRVGLAASSSASGEAEPGQRVSGYKRPDYQVARLSTQVFGIAAYLARLLVALVTLQEL